MEIIKITSIALIALIIIILLKQYKPEFAIYISILTGILIIFLVMDKFTGIIELIRSISNKSNIYRNPTKNNRNCTSFRICSKYLQGFRRNSNCK